MQLWWSHKKPRAKSGEHYLDALALINLFGSYQRFGKNDSQQIKKVKENVFLVCLWHLIIWWFGAGRCLNVFLYPLLQSTTNLLYFVVNPNHAKTCLSCTLRGLLLTHQQPGPSAEAWQRLCMCSTHAHIFIYVYAWTREHVCILWMVLGLICLSFRVCFFTIVQASNWTHVLNSTGQDTTSLSAPRPLKHPTINIRCSDVIKPYYYYEDYYDYHYYVIKRAYFVKPSGNFFFVCMNGLGAKH